MWRPPAWLVPVAGWLVVIAAAGCGGGEDIDQAVSPSAVSTEPAQATGPASPSPSASPTPSPGSPLQMAYWRDFEVWLMDGDGRRPRPLVTDLIVETGPTWSPDGTMLAFTGWDPDEPHPEGAQYEVWIADLDGETTQVTEMPGDEMALEPSWSPDGTRIAFASTAWDLWTIDIDGTGLTRLTEDSARQNSPAWSPDGSLIAYCSTPVKNKMVSGREDIWVMTADGSDRTRLTDTGSSCSPAWSPDGTRIAFETWVWAATPSPSGSADFSDVWIMDADGSRPRNLSDDPTRCDGRPDWSPDGSMIVFDSACLLRVLDDPVTGETIGHDPPADIYVADALGATKTRLTTSDLADANPEWQPTAPEQ